MPGRSLGGVRLGETAARRPRRARRASTASATTARGRRGTSRTRRSTAHGLAVEFIARARLRRSTRSGSRRAGTRRTASASARRALAVHELAGASSHGHVRRLRGARRATGRARAPRTTSSTASSGASGSSARGARAPLPSEHRARTDVERGRAATRRRRAPHAGRHVAHARRARRRPRPRQGGVLPARRRLQVPRRVQQDLVARRGRARSAASLAYSSGNHAQAVALAAALLGSRRDDRDARGRAGREARGDARLRRRGRARTTAGRRAARRSARALAEERGLALVPPYDDPLVMAGQGTVALELLDDVPELDVLLVPVSGGGLIAGCATAAKALRPGDPRRRRRAGDRQRHAPLARGRRARAHRRAAHDRRRAAGDRARRADVRGQPAARGRDRDGDATRRSSTRWSSSSTG